MTNFKIVSAEPTEEMVEAAKDAYMPFGDMELAIRMAVLAAPVVQGEPVAWKEPAANWLREKAAAQQALNEQYPEHDKCYPAWVSWVLKLNWLADELSVGVAQQSTGQGELIGYIRRSALELMKNDELGIRANIIKEPRYQDCVALYTTPQPAEQQPAPDVAGLVEALEAVVAYDESAEDEDGNLMIHYADMMKKVREALAAHRKQGVES